MAQGAPSSILYLPSSIRGLPLLRVLIFELAHALIEDADDLLQVVGVLLELGLVDQLLLGPVGRLGSAVSMIW
jgi:hypothetical protein